MGTKIENLWEWGMEMANLREWESYKRKTF